MKEIARRYSEALAITEESQSAAILVLASVVRDLDSNLQDKFEDVSGSLSDITKTVEWAANNR